VGIKDSRIDSMKDAIRKALNLINYDLPEKTERIVIKPNLCYYWDYSTGQTTDPEFVAALIHLIREKSPNSRISIVESDASAMKCRRVYRMLGYERMRDRLDVELVNLSEEQSDPVKVRVAGKVFSLMLPRIIQQADLKINVPKIKYMIGDVKMTCALKNIFGCNPYPKKFRLHSELESVIVALNKITKFNLCLVDGNIVSGVQPRRLGLVMAGTDPVAVDVEAAKIAGVNPKRIGYLRLAHKEGMGNLAAISVGETPDFFRQGYPRRTATMKLKNLASKLVVRAGLGARLGLE
jgi:uncharacterized protein (DUF362 family)